jgi:opacity protein-like surface antigen
VHHLGTGVHRFSAGEITRVPLQLTALARFRPQARFNPYVGGGFGYAVVGFEPSDELDQLSVALDSSFGVPGRLFTDNRGSVIITDPAQQRRQLGGATVEAEDAWEWHVVGGAEIGFGKRWAMFFDLRYTDATQSFRLQFDGQDELGHSVPQGRTTFGSDLANAAYGPLYLFPGGLLDVDGDGDIDSGLYYATGGELRYDGLAAQLGVRYTF